MNTCWKKLWHGEQGAVTVETALLFVLVGIAVVLAFTTLGETISDKPTAATRVFEVSEVHP